MKKNHRYLVKYSIITSINTYKNTVEKFEYNDELIELLLIDLSNTAYKFMYIVRPQSHYRYYDSTTLNMSNTFWIEKYQVSKDYTENPKILIIDEIETTE